MLFCVLGCYTSDGKFLYVMHIISVSIKAYNVSRCRGWAFAICCCDGRAVLIPPDPGPDLFESFLGNTIFRLCCK